METSEKLTQWILGLVLQGHPGTDVSGLLLGVVLLFAFGERRSLGRVVLAIGLVMLFAGHLAVRITMPGSPA
jgi:hypothetical protein